MTALYLLATYLAEIRGELSGEEREVTFTLSREQLQMLDRDMHWVVVPGDFEIMVGRSSEDIPLKGTLKVRD